MRVSTVDLVAAYINKTHGWAVADQFSDTYEGGQSFEEQNMNALNYIAKSVRDILNSDLLGEYAENDLNDYYETLQNYLFKAKIS